MTRGGLLQEVQALDSPEALHSFMAHHGEKIVDQLGAEVDRIEQEIKVFFSFFLSSPPSRF